MTLPRKIALIAVTRHGCEQAIRVRTRLRAGHVYRPAQYGPSQANWEQTFDRPLSEVVPELWREHEQLVFFLAAGAVVRLVAPHLQSKQTDPGVLAIDERGEFVIPLVSGHEGGANHFARQVAASLGATPVVTTASDSASGFNLATLAESYGWIAEPAEHYKPTAMALVNRQPLTIVQEIGHRGCWIHDHELPENVHVVRDVEAVPNDESRVVLISDRQLPESEGLDPQRVLFYRPKSLVVGVGCERGISAAALEDGLRGVLEQIGLAWSSIGTIASLDVKADEQGLLTLAERHGWQTIFYTAAELSQVRGVLNPSAAVEACVGTPAVAEAAALITARTESLLVEKQIVASPLATQRMTLAIARDSRFEAPRARGGRLTFVSAGPGDPDLLTLKAHRLIRQADVVVYAGSLVSEEVVRQARPTARLHNSASMTLEETIDVMISASRRGEQVVRLQSGDTSIYSAIQEQMTQLDAAQIPYDVVPGVSSFQAAAAALRTELTLPEAVQTVILTRGAGRTPMPPAESLASLAAHRATLCIFLSALVADEVQAELLTAYPPETPVALLYRVSWPDENIITTTLAELSSAMRAARFTRTTLILVGDAVGGRKNRSQLYDQAHGHLFRASQREAANPSA
jgi:precorrin-4 C11-methyltransferase